MKMDGSQTAMYNMGTIGRQSMKSSTLCGTGGKMINQMMVQKHLMAHYKKLERVKPSVDTSAPKAWIARKKDRSRGSTPRCSYGRQSLQRSAIDGIDLYGCETFESGHHSLPGRPHSVAGDGQMSSPYYDFNGSTRLHTNTPVTEPSARAKHERERRHYAATGVNEPRYDNNDLIQRHRDWFRKERAFTPRTLQSSGVPSRLSTMSSCYRNPRRSRPRDHSSSEDEAEPTGGGPPAGTNMADTITFDTLRSRSGHHQSTPDDVPPLGISLDADHMKYLKEQSHRIDASKKKSTTTQGSSSVERLSSEAVSEAALNKVHIEQTTSLPHKRNDTNLAATKRDKRELDDEQRYQEFIQAVTSDVLLRGIYTNRGLNQVFESHIEKRTDLRESKMRTLLEDLRKNLGVPHEEDMDGRDYGFRSTLSVRQWESEVRAENRDSQSLEDRPGSRLDRDSSSEGSVVTQRAASPPRRSPPPRPASRSSAAGGGRPPLPRARRGHTDSLDAGSQYSVEVRDDTVEGLHQLADPGFRSQSNASVNNANVEESDDGLDEVDARMPRDGRLTPSSARNSRSPKSALDNPATSSSHSIKSVAGQSSRPTSAKSSKSVSDHPGSPGRHDTKKSKSPGGTSSRSTKTSKVGSDQIGSSPPTSARKRRTEYRKSKNDLSTTTTMSAVSTGPGSLDSPGLAHQGPDDDDDVADRDVDEPGLGGTRTIGVSEEPAVSADVENFHQMSLHESDAADGLDEVDGGYSDSYDDDDTNEQLLDTIEEYQLKLAKTNLIDEAPQDSPEEGSFSEPAPVPQPRRPRTHSRPESPRLPDPARDSPSESLDISELEDDDYIHN